MGTCNLPYPDDLPLPEVSREALRGGAQGIGVHAPGHLRALPGCPRGAGAIFARTCPHRREMAAPFYCTTDPDWTRADLLRFEVLLAQVYITDDALNALADNCGLGQENLRAGTPRERVRHLINGACAAGRGRELVRAVLRDGGVGGIHGELRKLTGTPADSVEPPLCPDGTGGGRGGGGGGGGDDPGPAPWVWLVVAAVVLGLGVAAWAALEHWKGNRGPCQLVAQAQGEQGEALQGVSVTCKKLGRTPIELGQTGPDGRVLHDLDRAHSLMGERLACRFGRDDLKVQYEPLDLSCGAEVSAVLVSGGDDGTGDDGVGDEGTGDEGTGEDGTGDEGTGGEGTGDEGTGDEGTGNDGTGGEGTGGEGTGRTLEHDHQPVTVCYVNKDGGVSKFRRVCVAKKPDGKLWCDDSTLEIAGCTLVKACVIQDDCLD